MEGRRMLEERLRGVENKIMQVGMIAIGSPIGVIQLMILKKQQKAIKERIEKLKTVEECDGSKNEESIPGDSR